MRYQGFLALALVAGFLVGPVAAQNDKKDDTKAVKEAEPAVKDEGPGLKSIRGKVCYGIGMSIGANFKSQGIDTDMECLMQGIRDALEGKKAAIPEEEIQAAMQAYQKQLEGKKRKVGEDYLAENKKKPGVKTTETGLQYKVLKEGKGPIPKKTDSITAHYKGTLIDGTEFDSSIKRGQPAKFPVNRVIPGWTEALQLMPVGSKWELVIPSDLAYGPQGTPGIPPHATLVFEVELLSIDNAKE